MYIVFLDLMRLHTQQTTVWYKYSFYMHWETKKHKFDLIYCNIYFTAVFWNQMDNISKVCLTENKTR